MKAFYVICAVVFLNLVTGCDSSGNIKMELKDVTLDGILKSAGKLDGRSLVHLLESAEALRPDRALITHVGRWNNGVIDTHKYCQCNVRWGKYAMVRIEYCDDPDCHGECRIIRNVQNGGEGYYSKKYANFHYAVTPKGQWTLYDIRSDLAQEHNIAAEHPEIIEKLSAKYKQWWKEVYPHVKWQVIVVEADLCFLRAYAGGVMCLL